MKYAPSCKCEEGGVVIASVPDAAPVDRGLAGPGLLAHVVVSKYADHLPLHRLEEIFERQGVHIARSTKCDWVDKVADLLGPITNAMAKASLSAHRIHTDDTGIPILAPGSTHKGHVWVYVADDEYVVFRYTPRRESEGPREFLKGYTGYVQADAANATIQPSFSENTWRTWAASLADSRWRKSSGSVMGDRRRSTSRISTPAPFATTRFDFPYPKHSYSVSPRASANAVQPAGALGGTGASQRTRRGRSANAPD